jgi:hypothetical protein
MEVEHGDYSTTPKAEHLGSLALNPFTTVERQSPVRSAGESETRHSGVTFRNALGELIKPEQMKQVLMPRGLISDIDSDIFAAPTINRTNYGGLLEQYVASTLGPDQQAMIKPNEDGSYEVIKVGDEPTSAQKALLYNRQQLREGNAEHNRQLSDSEYFNRKLLLNASNADFDGNALQGVAPRPLVKFIFEPNTVMRLTMAKAKQEVRIPFGECLFIFNSLVPGGEMQVLAKEISTTKFFFWMTIARMEVMVQVNQFRDKKKGKVYYKAFLAEGIGKVLSPDHPANEYKDEAECLLDPIFGFLDARARGVYAVECNGDYYPSNQIPGEAKEGDVYKILKMIPKRDPKARVWKGGTHASPREHERQDHWRTLRNGERRHFPAVTVNKGKTKGKVIKDYQIVEHNNHGETAL